MGLGISEYNKTLIYVYTYTNIIYNIIYNTLYLLSVRIGLFGRFNHIIYFGTFTDSRKVTLRF